jgi:DNA-binding IclR family transcriptional regulator
VSAVAERAFRILEQVARSEQPLGLMELATRLKADKSATTRSLAFLEERGMVRRDSGSKKCSGPSEHVVEDERVLDAYVSGNL